jgi:tetratricopeptide (TPR) repeat protein
MRGERVAAVLDRPGGYAIHAAYSIPKDWPHHPLDLQSNLLQLTVHEPEGLDLSAYDLLRGAFNTKDRGPWNIEPDSADAYRAVLEDYPSSQYARHCKQVLAAFYHFRGIHTLRGTPDGAADLRRSANMYLSLADQAGKTHFAMRMTRAAARGFAQSGNPGRAEALFEHAFLSPAATEQDRLELLHYMDYTEQGGFHRSGGIPEPVRTTRIALPLRPFARALGYGAHWDDDTKRALVLAPAFRASFHPGDCTIRLDGRCITGVRTSVERGRVFVSPSLVAALFAEEYGLEIAHAFGLSEPPIEATAPQRLPGPGAAPNSFPTLRIQSPKHRVLLGEPVTITVSLANEGDEPIVVSPIMVLEASFLKLWVRDPGGSLRRCEPFALATVVCIPALLYPSQSVGETYALLWNWDGRHAFPTAGRYEVSATFEHDGRSLRSNTVIIEVLEPQGADAEAFPLVFADDSARFLQLQSYHYQEGIANLRKLLSDYPDCTYAPYATYALAHRASREGLFSEGPGMVERIPPTYDEAIAGFERIVREWPNSAVADDAQFDLARTYFDMEERNRARQALVLFFDHFAPTSQHLAQAVYLSERLEWEEEYTGPGRFDVEWVAVDDIALPPRARMIPLAGPGTVLFTYGETVVEVQAGRDTANLGPHRVPLTHRIKLDGGRLLVPASFARLLPRLLVRGSEVYSIRADQLSRPIE